VGVYPEERASIPGLEEETPSSRTPVVASVRTSSTPPVALDEFASQVREKGVRRWRVAVLGAAALLVVAGFAQARASSLVERGAAKVLEPVKQLGGPAGSMLNPMMLTECPDEMALVEHAGALGENVCVDRWEGSIVETTLDGQEIPWSPYEPIASGAPVKAVSKPGVVPQGYISQREAQEACSAAGKRLCTSTEWVTACEGPDSTQYPYGASEDPKACNTKGQSPLRRVFGSLRHAAFSLLAMNNPLLNKLPGTVAKTGAFDKCTNEYGLYDMVGNLHEWTADDNGATGVFRGGYYLDTTVNGKGCGYATTAHGTWYHDYSTGFRCCKDAE
jgi:hypothetical protein